MTAETIDPQPGDRFRAFEMGAGSHEARHGPMTCTSVYTDVVNATDAAGHARRFKRAVWIFRAPKDRR